MRPHALLTLPTAAALLAAGLLAHPAPAGAAGTTVEVATAKDLKAALAAAAPGQTIHLADGTYVGNFKAYTPGTAAAPITLTGSANAVLSSSGGYGLYLDGASYWTVQGLTVTGGQKGIVTDTASHVVIDAVTVHDLQMEGVHFRTSSTDDVIRNSRIYNTGLQRPGYGEGVYVGTANTLSDTSDRVQILDNVIGPNVGAENIDLKEGTTGGLVSGNTFDGSGLSMTNYDDSWVDVKGNDYVITGNHGTRTLNDGYQTHTQQPGWGCGTVFRDNVSDLTGATGATQLAIDVTNSGADCPTTVSGSNTVTGGKGLTNVPVTP
ncbi:right-handed parallel beta-helix repeat-containing protein [Actinacidiphila rubida]|uniref:Right handed beta helix region n=1 Tax=Actinacidiphila rubida TaxID=310780 RepID=A0A1H8IGQ2_9ACTN|nr:right-handed parallel beta-helix repeat-containing protein [Actinacidiphila rubida]SEN67462.1 Right handed beta helix region [Actinacidiphila rubida]